MSDALTVTDDGGLRRLVLQGEVDVVSVPVLLPDVTAALESAPGGAVRLDLAAVTFFDSSGVRLVDQCQRLAHARALRLSIVAPRGSMVRRVLELTQVALDLLVDGTD